MYRPSALIALWLFYQSGSSAAWQTPRPFQTVATRPSPQLQQQQPPRQKPSVHHRAPRVRLASSATVDKETTTLPSIHLFNSKTRAKEELQPVTPGQFSLYTCGPTVYDYAHVGNFRAFLTYDLLKRVLEYFGYNVEHVCNLTDVDDKIIQRATEQGLTDVSELTLKYEALFLEDLRALNIRLANHYPRATEHIPEMMEMILLLRDKGLAYETSDGSWYFRTQAQANYGTQLVQLNYDEMEPTDRTAADEQEKEHFADFALWKAFKEGVDREDAVWSSDQFQRGRPGWHLECSAMIRKFFGDQTIDLHGGGVDLKFPHHENEIAQSEGCMDDGQTFCNCWFHNGFVNIGDEKMSKSLGNFLTLRGACPTSTDVRAYRYLVVSSQYRAALAFTPQAVQASKNAIQRIDKVRGRIQSALQEAATTVATPTEGSKLADEVVPAALRNFEAALRDDLSMPRAAAALFGLLKAAEKELKRVAKQGDGATLDTVGLQAILDAMDQMDQIFGILYEVPLTDEEKAQQQKAAEDEAAGVPEEVVDLVSQRTAAKDAKDWELADSLRARISELGFAVKDVKGGEPIISRL